MRTFSLQAMFPGVAYHVARRVFGQGEGMEEHCHDFCEVFWLESGSMRHHVAGAVQELVRGDAVFIRPNDAHSIEPCGQSGCTMVNFALPREAARAAEQCYGQAYWSSREKQPRVVRGLDGRRLNRMAEAIASLPTRFTLPRHRDLLLLTLYEQLPGEVGVSDWNTVALQPGNEPPVWLRDAVEGLSLDDLREGGVALERRAGRSREHLSRALARYYGRSTTRWINDQRLEYAARALTLTNRPILDVCFDCGFENLSYFYRLFTRRFGTSPRLYRLRDGRLVR